MHDFVMGNTTLSDSNSLQEYLKERLDIYLSHLQKVRVIRHAHSMGLMVARQRGIDESLTDIIVVMDSHMEVAEGKIKFTFFYSYLVLASTLIRLRLRHNQCFSQYYCPLGSL